MADWLEQMVGEIRSKQAALDNQKRAANDFARDRGEVEPFIIEDADGSHGTLRIKADEYYGKGFATAAGNYMERRKTAVTHEEVLRALEQGGFDFDALNWKADNRARTVAMSLAKNTAIFHRLPNGMFGLKKWYGDAIDKKKSKKGDVTAEEESTE
ncbi:MAG: hypothetical protein ACRD3G_08070 [Vicinamibacterales bacterium]